MVVVRDEAGLALGLMSAPATRDRGKRKRASIGHLLGYSVQRCYSVVVITRDFDFSKGSRNPGSNPGST